MSTLPVSINASQQARLNKGDNMQPHPWKTIDSGRERHTLVMLRQRELFGPRAAHARRLTRLHRPTQLNAMAANSSAMAYELVKHGVFLGLSHDSRYVIAQVKKGLDGTFASTSTLDFNFDDDESEDTQSLVICELSPKRLVPRVILPMCVSSLCYIYAFLPKDSSFLAAMAFPCDQMAPCARDPTPTTTVQTSIEVVLMKYDWLHIAAKLNVLTSCRWRQPKLTRHPLRVFDNGIIVNTGTTVVALRFGKGIEIDFFVPSLWSDTDVCNRKMWAVTSESNAGGGSAQGGMLHELVAERPYGDTHQPLTLRPLSKGQTLYSNALLVLTETWLEMEPIIDQVAKSVCAGTDVSYDGLVDYEL
uniref:Uncharacterized protein n=1 Tax=Plectus sambesii TaxID=2011161 RepID=A0A914VXM0_9BILA